MVVNLSLQALPDEPINGIPRGRFSRVLTPADWRQLTRDIPDSIMRSVRSLMIIEGETEAQDTGNGIKEVEDQRKTMLLHRDSTYRIMSTPKGGRKNGTWFIHPEDYLVAQMSGLRHLLDSGKLQLERNLKYIADLIKNLGLIQRENIPLDSEVVSDPGMDAKLVIDYQGAVLATPGIRARRMTWEELSNGRRKIAAVMPGTPHFQEIQNEEQFSHGYTVNRVDARIDA